jgi:cyanophycin synthetase
LSTDTSLSIGRVLRVLGVRSVSGYLVPARQPTLLVTLEQVASQVPESVLRRFNDIVAEQVNTDRELSLSSALDQHVVCGPLLRAVLSVLDEENYPLLGVTTALSGGGPRSPVRVILPAWERGFQHISYLLYLWVDLFNALFREEDASAFPQRLKKLRRQLAAVAPQGLNTIRFIQAAHEAGLPWRWVTGNVVQYGWGVKARWLDSSFTDETAQISSRLVRNKLQSTRTLRQLGVPVPENRRATSPDEAVKAADELGYPVVLKVADLDGGRGIFVGLRSAAEVRAAWHEAAKLSKLLMVEKFVRGNDYRVQVYRDEVYHVSHRMPGGVTGDGERTVRQLLDELNADPMRGEPGSNALLKKVYLDEEASALLADSGLAPESVPEEGRFVRLRRASNVALGGRPVPVLEQAHPDNLELAIRVARLLRLDLAGIDLLMPDISQSWRESGGAICEVNAQPQLFTTLPRYLLQKLVPGNGRIPVIVVVTADTSVPWYQSLCAALQRDGRGLGQARPDGAWIGEQKIIPGPLSFYAGALALLSDPAVHTLLAVPGDARLASGLPVDRVDCMVVVGATQAALETRLESRLLALASVSRILLACSVASPLLDKLAQKSRLRQVEESGLAQAIMDEVEKHNES